MAANSPFQRTIRLRRPLDLQRTLAITRPQRVPAPGVWRATRTPCGPGTERLWLEGDLLHAQAWGPGADWLLDHVPDLVGERAEEAPFTSPHRVVGELARRHPGLRIPSTQAVLEAAVPTILEQKVIGQEARLAYRLLLRDLGEPAPGPVAIRLPPAPQTLAGTPYWHFHTWGVERRRAEIVIGAAQRATRLEEAVGMSPSAAARRLEAIPGLGPWSAAEIGRVALGDQDAVSVGDYNLPHQVCWALAGEARGSDARMLELLEPFRGRRALVVRLIEVAGFQAPRRGPRLALSRIARL